MSKWQKLLICAALAPLLLAGEQSLAPPDLGQLSRKQFEDRLSKALAASPQLLPSAPVARLSQGEDGCAIPLLEGRVSPTRRLQRETLPAGSGNIDHMPILVGRVCRDWLKK